MAFSFAPQPGLGQVSFGNALGAPAPTLMLDARVPSAVDAISGIGASTPQPAPQQPQQQAQPQAPSDPYKPSVWDIAQGVLFNHLSPADAAVEARERNLKMAVLKQMPQAMSDFMSIFGAPSGAGANGSPGAAPGTQQSGADNGGGMPQEGVAAAPSLMDPRVERGVIMANAFGVPGAATALDVLKATLPKVAFDRGWGYNNRTGAPMGGYHPDLPQGAVPVFDANGNFAGARMADGTIQAIAQTEGAKTNAQEAAKAAYDLVPVPQSDGTSRLMPRSIALGALTGAPSAAPGAQVAQAPSGAPGQGAAAPMLGVTQSPAAADLAKARAATQGEREKSLPSSTAMLQDTDNLIGQFNDTVQRMLGERLDPKTGNWEPIPGAKPEINGWSAGRLFGEFPALTGQATNLDADLDGLRALISSEKLAEMRRAAGGGSLNMRTTQGEIFNIFGNLAGPLHQTQDPAALRRVLRDAVGRLQQTRDVMHQQYQQEFGDIQQPTPGTTAPQAPNYAPNNGQAATPSRAALIAEARRRGLIK